MTLVRWFSREFGLEQEIIGIGVVTQDSVHSALAKDTTALGGISLLVEPLGNGDSTFSFWNIKTSIK